MKTSTTNTPLFSRDTPDTATLATQQAHYQAIFAILDGYREGTVTFEQVRAIDKHELREARAWMRDKMNARLVEAFPEIDKLNEL